MKLCRYLLPLCLCSIAQAEVSVISHPSLSASVDKDTISRLFLGKTKTFGDGSQMVPLVLSDPAAAEEFNTKALGKSSSQLKAYWSQLVFTGKGTPPKEIESTEEMIALIAANPNMVGFVSGSVSDGRVQVIASY